MAALPRIHDEGTRRSLESLFSNSRLGCLLIDAAGVVVDANAVFLTMCGVPLASLIGANVQDFTHPDDQLMTSLNLAELHPAGDYLSIEKRYLKPDGNFWWARLRTFAERDLQGQVLRRIALVEDVTAQRTLGDFQEEMAAIVEQSDDAIIHTDIEGKITYWSPGAIRLYGYSAEEVMDKRSAFLVANLEDPRIVEMPTRLLRGEVVTDQAGLTRHKDGRLLNVSVLVFSIDDPLTASKYFVGVHRDIGELKRMEEQVRHAQRMETAGQLAGGIAHDFNNILTAVHGTCGALADELPANFPGRQFLTMIDQSAERASRLTKQLQTFSRKQLVAPTVVSPQILIQEFLPMLKSAMGQTIALETRLFATRTVQTDPVLLEQAILNLCNNAQQAMPGGGKLELEISDFNAADFYNLMRVGCSLHAPLPMIAGDSVLISVSDNGIGIREEILPHIFDPFFTTKTQGKGTGLGLAIVYGLVVQSGGYIQVQSRVGSGSVFQILLPVMDGAPANNVSESVVIRPMGKGRVLVLEDDFDIRLLLGNVLERAGYNVITASDPIEVLQRGIGVEVDLVLSDVVMPGMNGPEFSRQFAKQNSRAVFLFMTGYLEEKRYPDFSIRDKLLLKPFKPADLLARVELEFKRMQEHSS